MTNKSPAFQWCPNASYEILPKEYLTSAFIAEMSLEEEAIFCRQLDSAALRGDEEFLKQFPFIGRVFFGTSKRESLAPSIKKKVLSAGKCAYCESTEKLQVDHIVPYSKGGTHDISNLQCLCRKCNRAKSDMTEEEYFARLKNE